MTTHPDFVLFRENSVDRMELDMTEGRISGNPHQGAWLHALDRSGRVKTGVWEATAGVFQGTMENQVEFCHILEGEATIIDKDEGLRRTVRAGDAFFMENGYSMIWEVPEYIKKHYVVCAV